MIIKHHGDKIAKLPDNFVVYGQSYDCLEIFISNDNRYFGIQGHPEYYIGQLSGWRARIVTTEKETPFEIETIRKDLVKTRYGENIQISEDEWRKLCYYFLKF